MSLGIISLIVQIASAAKADRDQRKAKNQADDLRLETTAIKVEAQKRQRKIQAGQLRAALGASGFNVNIGSALDVQTQFESQAEFEARSIEFGGEVEQFGIDARDKAARTRNQEQIVGGIFELASQDFGKG